MPHEFDAAIQYGYGNWPSANARYLIGKETSIVCSPQLRDALPCAPRKTCCAQQQGANSANPVTTAAAAAAAAAG